VTEQDDLSNLDTIARAYALVECLNDFVCTFNDRAGEQHAHRVIHGKCHLDGERIGQAPEQFIYEELVEPVATNALGYELRFQPKGFDGLDGRIPDFEILNIDAENFGEVKTPGRIDVAREESVAYLDRADQRPLAGVATDGRTWILHTADEDEEPQYTRHVSLHKLLGKVNMVEVQSIDESRHPELREMGTKFVEEFNVGSIQLTLGSRS
jgi:hypothetical protein